MKERILSIKKTFRFLKPYFPLIAISVLIAAASVVLSLYIPILSGRAIDCIAGKGSVDFSAMRQILGTAAAVIVAVAVLQWILSTVSNKITFNVVRDVRKSAFRKLQSLPVSYIDSNPSGETVSRIISDVDTFADGLLMGFTQLFTGIVTIIGTLAFMFSLNARIALAVVVITPLSLIVAKFISTRTYSMFRLQSETRAEQTAFIDEMIGNQKVVRAFSYEKEVLRKYDQINDRLEKASVKAIFFSSLVNPSTRFVNNLVYAAVGCFGALSVIGLIGGTAMTVGTLAGFLSYANQYTKPFNEISGVITELQNAAACMKRVIDFLEEPSQTPETENAFVLSDVKGNIKIDKVDFSYVPNRELIKNLDLSVLSGQRVAIVGPTGCGKTTVINLLMRFYDVDSGYISVDSHDIRDVNRESLHRSYGMVLQETWLKSGTIADNIKIGKPDATKQEIIAAAKAAHAHSFIKRLPLGYDTVITENGGSLSQGQKQLLCIARVMLCLPPMLILDEATSSIDTRTEQKIQSAFQTMMQGRTSFIVAHRLSTIREADIILVMNNGRVIEKGNHKQLLEKCGFYAKLYNSQFENSEI